MTGFNFTVGRHTEQAHDYAADLINEAYKRKTTAGERIDKANALCEAHYDQVGQYPASDVLSRLAWYILYDEMTDSHPDKMTREEYPVMSEWQKIERNKKQCLPGEITFRDRQHNGRRKASFIGDNGEIGVSKPKMPNKYDVEMLNAESRVDVMTLIKESGLTDRQRQAIDLVYLGDMTQEQAAEVMGVTQQVVDEHLTASFRKIKKYLRKYTCIFSV